jgi:DNA-binding CsgD family transcriptional regulator
MYLSDQQTGQLADLMSTLAEPFEEEEIRSRVGARMMDLLGAQYYASYVWDAATQTFGHAVQINMDPANLLQYERYFQYHDPITPAMQQHRRAVRASDVLAQEQLMRTEFFNDFLARDGLHWGVNLYAWDGDQNIGDMRIWRDRRRSNFSADDLQLLDLVRPAFVAALRRCRQRAAPAIVRSDSLLEGLSGREREVARLVSCGLTDKEVGRRLGISLTTVRTHIGHAFRKLDVDNRMKLVQLLRL